ncbi:hypothetical protein ABZ953_06520 [Streptomyces sp. NPDC046465]|uniref:hypothetical protein n=1 Tax=Streptomyces sp. NPDC046465 TaxID=3155810 RepID=UPI0033EBE208
MTYRPLTVYVVACDARGCTQTVHFYDYDADEQYEMRLDKPEMSPRLRREITQQGWMMSGRWLCPDDAKAAADTAVERIEIELTHEALFDLQQHDAPTGDAS